MPRVGAHLRKSAEFKAAMFSASPSYEASPVDSPC